MHRVDNGEDRGVGHGNVELDGIRRAVGGPDRAGERVVLAAHGHIHAVEVHGGHGRIFVVVTGDIIRTGGLAQDDAVAVGLRIIKEAADNGLYKSFSEYSL